MPSPARTIAVCNDFLRDLPNQLDNATANRSWLAAVVRHLAGPGFQVQELGNDQPGLRHLDTVAFMRTLDLPISNEGWAAAWDGEPSDRFVKLLTTRLAATNLVVGFGLPNVVVRALQARSIRFIDFEISPLRFAASLEVDIRTNVPALTGCPAWQLPLAGFDAAAIDLVGWAARFCPNSIPADAGQVGVIFGQTELDAALVHDGRIAGFPPFAPAIRQWAAGLDHVLFRPHPYATSTRAFEDLRRILPTIRPTLMNSYQLLASQRLSRVLALSSGIIDEATCFHTPAMRLFMPKRRTAGLHYSIAGNLNVLRGDVLEPLLTGQPLPPVEAGRFDLRKQFRVAWGLTDQAVPSDFHAPPAAGSGRFNPRRMKLRHRLRKFARQLVAGVSLPGRRASARAAADAVPPAGRLAARAKDFSYGSGERQTAHEYDQIRRDHRTRYELAHRLLPPDIAVLDLFCGNGYGSFLLSQNREVHGIDGSQPAIEVAEKCFRNFGATFAARCYPFEDGGEYDAIVSYESIEHVPDGAAFFRFLVSRLRPGGMILYSTPNEDLLPFDRTRHIHHHRHYSHRETLDFALASGLRIESWYGQDVYAGASLLDEQRMELQRGTPGQFTVVVARKPAARAA